MKLDWQGGRNEVGMLAAEKLKTKISIPQEMDGPGVGTNPDEMLLGAAATCYLITLAAMLERARIDATLSMQSEGIVDVTNGVFTYEEILHDVTIHGLEADEKTREMALKYAHKAEQTCMISKALAGNVDIHLHVNLS